MMKKTFHSRLCLFLIIFLLQLHSFIKCEEAYFNDLRFTQSVNIKNTGIEYGEVDLDHRVIPVWEQEPYPGQGVRISILSDGIIFNHTEIAENMNLTQSHNYMHGQDPEDLWPNINSRSVASIVAGVIAMTANNTDCSVGIAYNATIISRTIYNSSYVVNDTVLAKALYDEESVDEDLVDIVFLDHDLDNCNDMLKCHFLPDRPIVHDAIIEGTEMGRNGKGIFYITPIQGARAGNTNKSPTNKWREICVVTPISHQGRKTLITEEGSNIMFSGVVLEVTTGGIPTINRDAGYGFMCTHDCGVNTAAANVAGVAALVIQANPDLTWRDVQHILIETCYQNFNESSSWIKNGDKRWYSHKFGFGVPDAEKAVERAKNYDSLLTEEIIYEKVDLIEEKFQQINNTGLKRELNMTEHNITVFFVEVWVTVTHAYRGDLKITLTSPYNTPSYLAYPSFDYYDDLTDYTFSSWAYYGELCYGAWRLNIIDEDEYDVGNWESWGIRLYGINRANDTDPGPPPPTYTPSPTPLKPSASDPPLDPTVNPSPSVTDGSPSPTPTKTPTKTSSPSFTVWGMKSTGWFIAISLILLTIFI
ncbi:neuroendocrine convertase [Anaeramoeba flamelloides]|uniref:Neuroendocrine convertase n=1 Tax=Anaeramoeba flamelloides TaxID=1746091 RepID=A0AAV7YTC1_9EUKA|nr:neuroendocrine convertase [Anaeramoeba flamelloides]